MSNKNLAPIQSEKSSTSSIEQDEEMQCEQCSVVPDNYVKLDCGHKFCLICLSYNFIQQSQSEGSNQIGCSICFQVTILDPETIQALQEVIEDILIPLIQQQKEQVNEEADISNTAIKEDQFYSEEQQPIPTEPFGSSQEQSIQPTDHFKIYQQTYNQSHDQRLQSSILYILKQNQKVRKSSSLFGSSKSLFSIKAREFKKMFEAKCDETKDQLNTEFNQIMHYFEQQRNQFLNEINNIKLVYVMQTQNQEQDQENDAQKLQSFSEKLKQTIQQSHKYSSQQQMNAFQNLLMEIEILVSNFTYLDQSLNHQSSQVINKFKLQTQLFLQRYKSTQDNQHPEENKVQRDNQIVEILNTLNGKQNIIKNSKYLQNRDIKQISPYKHGLIKASDLTHSSSSMKLLSKSSWKDSLLDVFNKKPQQRDSSYNQQKQQAPTVSIHQALSMQQKNYIVQKSFLLQK